MMFKYIPYVQTNFVLGMDSDEGPEPFELTKKFVDRSPAAFPGYSLLSAFGEAAPQNLEYQKTGRVLPFPFYFLNNHLAMNIKPKNYEWVDFYEKVIDVTAYSFSKRSLYRRFKATPNFTSRWMNFMRAVSSEGIWAVEILSPGKEKSYRGQKLQRLFEGMSFKASRFLYQHYQAIFRSMWEWLPAGALEHDPNAYLKKQFKKNLVATST
jgi:hypothetical protein